MALQPARETKSRRRGKKRRSNGHDKLLQELFGDDQPEIGMLDDENQSLEFAEKKLG